MLTRAYIVGGSAAFPGLACQPVEVAPPGVLLVGDALFGASAWELERALDQAKEIAVAAEKASAVLTHLQRVIDRRNPCSRTPAFDEALARHQILHDLKKPLVRADYDHSRDTWQWTLRLDEEASAALQLAALFHDVERLVNEADARVEDQAADYDRFKAAHAALGAQILRSTLSGLPLPIERAATLVASHESPGADRERILLNDADALSFFSLNAGGYLDYFGGAQAKKKIAWTLARMSPRARVHLPDVRLRDDVHGLLEAA